MSKAYVNCENCGSAFLTNEEFIYHNQHQLCIPDIKSNSNNPLTTTVLNLPNNTYRCALCNVTFTNYIEKKEHMSSELHVSKLTTFSPPPLSLQDVQIDYNQYQTAQNSFNSNLRFDIDTVSDNEEQHFQSSKSRCLVCELEFSSSADLKQHLNTRLHLNNYQNIEMARNNINKKQIENVSTSVSFPVTSSQYRKTEPEQIVSMKNVSKWKCVVCVLTFSTQTLLLTHLKSLEHVENTQKLHQSMTNTSPSTDHQAFTMHDKQSIDNQNEEVDELRNMITEIGRKELVKIVREELKLMFTSYANFSKQTNSYRGDVRDL